MSAKRNKENTEDSPKEKMINQTSVQIAGALPSLKDQLGEKKFDKRIKKAAKLLLEGIKPEIAEIIVPVKKSMAPKAKKTKAAAPKKKAAANSK
ncbi:MAG: hypothetical protein ABIN94_01330 [Ferruginibacter sp.]